MNLQSIFIENDPIWQVLLRLAFHIVVLLFIVCIIYKNFTDKKGYQFAFFLIGIIVFLVCVVLKNVEMQLGMAFGLFALLSIVRYRTKNIPIKEMTYFFTLLGLSAINALIDFPHPYRGAILLNSIVIVSIFILEITLKKDNKSSEKKETKKAENSNSFNKIIVQYNKLELLDPTKMDELIKDVSDKTHIKVEQIQIISIDLLLNKAELMVDYKGLPPEKTKQEEPV